jgi:hypothetical protein
MMEMIMTCKRNTKIMLLKSIWFAIKLYHLGHLDSQLHLTFYYYDIDLYITATVIKNCDIISEQL